jgi:hypothetical protein
MQLFETRRPRDPVCCGPAIRTRRAERLRHKRKLNCTLSCAAPIALKAHVWPRQRRAQADASSASLSDLTLQLPLDEARMRTRVRCCWALQLLEHNASANVGTQRFA